MNSNDKFYSEDFKQVIEDHLPYLKRLSSTRSQSFPAYYQIQCKHNYYLLLSSIGVPYKYHWIIMRLNGYHSPMEFTGEESAVLIPDFPTVDRLMSTFNTTSTTLF